MQTICLMILLFAEFVMGQVAELDMLLGLKRGIFQDSSGKFLDSWDSNSLASNGCPLNWYGVTCSDGHVTSIVLNDVGLVGNFTFSAITGLSMLSNLSISNNRFVGTIEEEVGSLVGLEYLDISSNLFHGTIPSLFTSLKKLVYLNLSLNNLEGNVPSGFGNLQQLQYLDLHSNKFSGKVMDLFSQLGSVVYVDLSSNGFSGVLDLGLGNSSFVSSVEYLNISHNNLDGNLFSHDGMPYFDSLQVFDASNNQFVGNVPSFNFIVSLRVLRLGSNKLSGSIPEALLQESSMILSELDLSFNQLEGPIGSITSTTLRTLNLSSNKLMGMLPLKVGHCAVVDLSHNLLSGNVSRIQSWGNYVEIVDLSSNLLTGTLPTETSQFLRLTSLKISNNSIEGDLPPLLGTYPELEIIDFSLNHFTGALLVTLFNSTRLTNVNMSFNNFTGGIPFQANNSFPQFTQNLSLKFLDLSHNELTGPVPQEIGNFHNMEFLDLSNNHFEGHIPDVLPNELKGFNVSYNNLSGPVPDNLMKFPESAFHPGNYLLIFPYSASSPGGIPNIDTTRGSFKKPYFKAALIAGVVSGVFCMAIMIFVIYYRARHQERGKSHGGEKHGHQQEILSIPGTSSLNTDGAPSLTSASFPEEGFSSSQVKSTNDQLDALSVKRPKDLGLPELVGKMEQISSPMSPVSFVNPSSSSNHDIEKPGPLKAYSPDKLTGDLHLFHSSLVFSAGELSSAPAEVIGRSCHGTLYKAVLRSGQVLAVKWLKEGIAKGRKEFIREAKKLGSIKHPNLISLQGYYWGPRECEKLIITNYIDAPCLAVYLHETERVNLPPLTIEERLKIALDVACCLNYLHNERAIPHGNLKSTNILVEGSNLNVLLSDYSLHRLLTSGGTAEQVLNAGALGYRPPEFCSTSKPCPSLKSDVYAFGVILLELLTGKNSADIITGNPGVVDLTEWVRLLYAQNRSTECFDSQILDMDNVDVLKVADDMLQVALRCILQADDRPDMKSIFEDLSVIALEQTQTR